MIPGNYLYMWAPEHINCECCKVEMTTMTSTSPIHKWTRKEIQEKLISLSKEMVEVRWHDRGDVRRKMEHWVEKLKRLDAYEQEFK